MKKFISLTSLLLLLSSCAFHQGQLAVDGIHQTTHQLSRLAIGTAKTSYFLGIGGLKPDALLLEAKNRLYNNFPLAENEVYGTFSIDTKTSFYFIYAQTEIVISADILSQKESITSATPKDTMPLTPGTQIYLLEDMRTVKEASILRLKGNNTFQILTTTKSGHIQTKTKNARDLLFPFPHPINAERQNMLGQEVNFRTSYYNKRRTTAGKIIAIGKEHFLVEIKSNHQLIVLYYWEFQNL